MECRVTRECRVGPLLFPLLAGIVASAAACRPSPALRPPLSEAPGGIAALPATHETLSAVLAGLSRTDPGGAWAPSADGALRRYLEGVARRGPMSCPELFPSNEDVLAYLVNAHVAWALAVGHAARLARSDVAALSEEAFTVDGARASLSSLARQIASRAASEPRLALFINPGWRGGPPLPAAALEGRALDWQLTVHAERCGGSPGFWLLDRGARRLALPAYTDMIWGLPAGQPARARRLLDLVPPPAALRDAIIAVCGASLQHCVIGVTPTDTSRLFVPAAAHR